MLCFARVKRGGGSFVANQPTKDFVWAEQPRSSWGWGASGTKVCTILQGFIHITDRQASRLA